MSERSQATPKPIYLYTCNEGTFKVELIKREGFTVKIKLLERIPFRVKSKQYHHEIGDILSVGHWQVKKAV